MPPRQRKPDTRTGDRHKQVSVPVRLDDADFTGLEAARKAQGITRRQAVITAIREWVGRNLDKHDPDTKPEEGEQR